MPRRVLILLGTRPEVIKLAPVIQALRQRPDTFECLVCSTGQHREMANQAFREFEISPDIQLEVMSSGSSLGGLTARLFLDLDQVFKKHEPEWVIVQGDTTSAMAGAVSAFYQKIRIGHVEAGLRTGNRWSPFPEEINRTFISCLGDLHFAPTKRASENLRKAGVDASLIHVTGNTVIDALLWIVHAIGKEVPPELDRQLIDELEGKRLILVTSHRRESFGRGLENVCRALKEIVLRHPDVIMIYPMHLNPNVREPVLKLLGGDARIHLLKPIGYRSLVYLMTRSYCILTDSGGIQEEAPSLGKPVLIMREVTERPEVLAAGCARLVGTDVTKIVEGAAELLSSRPTYEAMSQVANPFGDGTAGERIAELLQKS
jgi:UDP-N-acetylglucosamine 2-epimerase